MKTSKLYLMYLAALSMLGFVATDMYLPAFKSMESFFISGPEHIAFSLTVFLIGMGSGQLLWGLASDKFGHRKTLLIGLLIFALSSFGLAFCDQIWQLLSLRFLQAVGVCAPAVIWQAMVIKNHSKDNSQQIFASIMPLVALSPALAPQLGVVLLNHFGWQSIFITLTLIGVLLVLATLKQPVDHVTPKTTSIASDIKALFNSKAYMGNVLMFATASAAFFAYLTSMPEIMNKLGYDAKDIGMSFIPQTIAFMVGGYLGKISVKKMGDKKVLLALLGLFTVSAITIFIASQMVQTSILPILIPFCFIAVANGALYPIVVNRALSSAKHSPATAAGLQNSLQICISSLASAIVAFYASQAQSVMGVVLLICLFGLWIGYFISTSRQANSTVASTH